MHGHRRNRAVGLVVLAFAMLAGATACGDSGPTGLKIEPDMVGIYSLTALRFDPQGSAPEANVLPLIESTQPQLVISQTGVFQIAFVDPSTHLIRTATGNVTRTAAGLRLVFGNKDAANELLLPERLELDWDAEAMTLTHTGIAEIPRARLLELFPTLYADEQLFDPTPGTLTVAFQNEGATTL